jgi:hypothetical protein
VYVSSAPPSSSSRRRLHRRPDVSRPTTLPSHALFTLLDFACGRVFELPRTVRATPPFLHGRTLRHAAPVRARHRGQPRPQRRALSVASRRVAALFVEPRTTPRRAAVPCATRATCLVFLWAAFMLWWCCVGKNMSMR